MKRYILFFFLIMTFLISIGCSGINQKKFRTEKEIIEEARFLEMVEKGDKEFEKMHWVGWTNSIRYYNDALQLKDSLKIREKLFFTLLHRAVRARFLSLPGIKDLEKAEQLLVTIKKNIRIAELYFKIAQRVIFPGKAFLFTDQNLKDLRHDLDKDYKYFFYILYQSRQGVLGNYRIETKKMIKLFPASNFKYFLRDIFIEIDKGIRGYPDFIELLLRRGDRFFNTGKLKKAEEYYLRVLEQNEKIPFALTGMGKIYLHYELYSKSLELYSRADDIAPLYYMNLFGKAVCLSQLGEHLRSVDVLNKMIDNDLPYLGEVYYYRAFNYFILKEYNLVEFSLKSSEKFIPDSVELNTLFGMFYYETKRFNESRTYFKKVVKKNKQYPRPYYYLGYLETHDNKIDVALGNFSLAAKYYLEMIKTNIRNINELKNQDLSEARRKVIRSAKVKRVRSKISEIIQKMDKVVLMFKKLKSNRVKFLHQAIKDLNKLHIPVQTIK